MLGAWRPCTRRKRSQVCGLPAAVLAAPGLSSMGAGSKGARLEHRRVGFAPTGKRRLSRRTPKADLAVTHNTSDM